ncbi:MAG: dTDP-4-dehydrorhamnose 3,5-epimerase [Bacteroidota bacterium]|nr:dTDP-4-dehydrorhamnose 3,5-epimerase [Candidatus Kapabacteria bacterium]MCS7302219.1 dTDP-4-dehydrorhamnose 3,5-epimerase [Candidatus Kapabacteria bacterium]MCX7937529.1 dTDP-4-dehydrorhamnose 3,5-epimerase [Chlorobiota bacterium]MDW8074839.1 dTDP-4-dehydrorhamnose 3,5-epimerase [Bacteroidota bacterium]MDW8271478.1 dTDP-4-dehydrorhamnose 3,5-epimerase [Bacteroidota bacterium]
MTATKPQCEIETTALDGIVVIRSTVHYDDRGYFFESFNARDFATLGLPTHFVQDNVSLSKRGVLRGLHFQWNEPMGKFLRVCVGRIQLVELDIRPDSPFCGKHWSIELTAEEHRAVWIPPGFANGFLVLSDVAIVMYKCTAFYNPAGEGVIRWDDPALGIPWMTNGTPLTSPKDAQGMTLAEWLVQPHARVFSYYHPPQ